MGWCPCSGCTSFSLDSIPRLQDLFDASMKTHYSKTLKWKQTGDLEGNTKQKCSEPTCDQSSSSIIRSLFDNIDVDQDMDIDEVEMEAEKENVGDRFSFDITSDELKKLMEGECLVNTDKNNEWAYKNFESWRTARNQRFPKIHCPDDVFMK